ncbi:MAG: tRNA-guanine transglycosylase, partial [Methanohalobium sp.]|uniref:tRNA-guanine transglycosylase n=1 Tax=Methanohalobium sp. TaxID=2837493 RepID=UPI00397D9629
LKPSSPVHLFGAGHPMGFALEVALGCDLFDSAAYALYAKKKRYITVYGTYHLENLHYLPCSCPICANYTAKELKDAENNVELLARHNLYVTFEEMNLVKQAIKEGDLLELVEQRCRNHPRLLEALKKMYSYSDWLEKYDPATKSTFFYCGPESSRRPEILHFSKRINRFTVTGSAVIRTDSTNWDKEFDNVLVFKPPMGSFPVELMEVYPFNLETISSPEYESMEVALLNTIKLIEQNPEAKFTFIHEYDIYHPLIDKISEIAKLVKSSEI